MIVAVAAKPKCILHIGPHKTGSTSLQSMLCDYKTKLNQDGFVFPQGMRSEHGRKHFKGCTKNMASVAVDLRANYTGPWDDITTTWKGWQPTIRHQSFGNAGVHTGFEQFLNHAEQKNQSIVVSSEEFDRPGVDCKIFKRWLRPFDTTVVVGYRPFFDFLLSIHKEINDPHHITFVQHHITFVQWLPTAIDTYWETFTVPVIARFEKCFDTIRILPLETGFLNTFACDIMQAGTLCTALGHLTEEIHSNARTERFDNTTCADKNSLDRIWQHSKTAATEVHFRLSQQLTSPVTSPPGLPPLNLASLRAQFDSRMFCNQPRGPKKKKKNKKKEKEEKRRKKKRRTKIGKKNIK